MHNKIKPVDNVRMLSLISLLSKYDLFHITTDNGREFNATEIVSENEGYLEFKRLLRIQSILMAVLQIFKPFAKLSLSAKLLL